MFGNKGVKITRITDIIWPGLYIRYTVFQNMCFNTMFGLQESWPESFGQLDRCQYVYYDPNIDVNTV